MLKKTNRKSNNNNGELTQVYDHNKIMPISEKFTNEERGHWTHNYNTIFCLVSLSTSNWLVIP